MRKFFFLLVLIILIVGGLGAWWINGTAPANPAEIASRTFEVSQGEGVREIANDLKAKGFIKDPIIFYMLIKQKNIGGKIQAGAFELSPSMSAGEIANVLQVAKDDTTITVPEGKRAEEVAEILKDHFSNYSPSWNQQLDANEGYLFPDTYSFDKNVTISIIISTMRANFDKKYASISDGTKSSMSQSQIVTIASIVEREAKLPEDRPLVASVIINRINAGMPLQVDATVQYALGYQPSEKNWWKTNLSLDDLKINSPYNTYVNTGLPPAPISNPGIEALRAVIEAPKTNYLFYVSDKEGHNHYEATFQEQLSDQQKYGIGN
ncbi:MAG TPA: endolytic transglycosylase MltG [Candidatus Saccharimonadales bacterium]|nr:endolytic transglycosylase MltG [Candidatus Saccharimonadales bacterium]